MNKCFTNVASSDRIMYGISQIINKNRRIRPKAGKRLIPLHLENFG